MRSRTIRTIGLVAALAAMGASSSGCAWIKALFKGKGRKDSRLDVLSGPLKDAMTYPDLVLVYPTGGNDAAGNGRIRTYLEQFSEVRRKSGGEGYEIRPDTEVADELLRKRTVVLYGNVGSNRVLQRIRDQLPLTLEDGSFSLGAKIRFQHPEEGVIFCTPSPFNPMKKYVLVYTGNSADAIIDVASVFHGPTDYVVFNKASKLASWGRDKIFKARGKFDKTDPVKWKLDPTKIEYPETTFF